MDTNTKVVLSRVSCNEGMLYIAEKTAQGYEKEKGVVNVDTALGFMHIVMSLITNASIRHPNSEGAKLMKDVNIATCEAKPVARWLQQFTDPQGVL